MKSQKQRCDALLKARKEMLAGARQAATDRLIAGALRQVRIKAALPAKPCADEPPPASLALLQE
jgi:hypothetical protein